NYGIGWLEPFTHQRFSFNTIYVADPFFSIPSGIICVYLIFQKSTHHKRIVWARRALQLTGLYLIYALFNKFTIESDVSNIAKQQGIHYERHFTTPSPFNTWLWFVVLEDRNGFYIGYRSVFDKKKTMDLHWYPQNKSLLKSIADHKEVMDLKQFSQGYYTLEQKKDTLIFNDLRFGQVIGWHDPTQPFAFHYYLNHPEDNNLVVQRGRFAKINAETMKSFWRRIRGEG
ncbi:MAG: metal-dependent hydrolase, partial [Chitinophagaceae bacterium]